MTKCNVIHLYFILLYFSLKGHVIGVDKNFYLYIVLIVMQFKLVSYARIWCCFFVCFSSFLPSRFFS